MLAFIGLYKGMDVFHVGSQAFSFRSLQTFTCVLQVCLPEGFFVGMKRLGRYARNETVLDV